MIGDDLAPLLAPGDPLPYSFRQGMVTAWDLFAGTNTISMAGGILTNVPFLGPGSIVELRAGDPVILIAVRSSWFILGKVYSPGGVNAIGRNTQATAAYGPGGVGSWSTTTTAATKTTSNIAVPPWATAACVSSALMVCAVNSTGAADTLRGQILMPDGSSAEWISPTTPAGALASVTTFMSSNLFVTPSGTLTVLGQVRTSVAGWAASANNVALLQSTVTFSSN